LITTIKKAYSGKAKFEESSDSNYSDLSLPDRMLAGWERFSGNILLVLSGKDYVAEEFNDTVATSKRWQKAVAGKNVQIYRLPESTHTFSSRVWRDEVAEQTYQWLEKCNEI